MRRNAEKLPESFRTVMRFFAISLCCFFILTITVTPVFAQGYGYDEYEDFLENDNYYSFGDEMDTESGYMQDYDTAYEETAESDTPLYALIVEYLLIALCIGAIPTLCMTLWQVRRMKTNVPQQDADQYADGGGIRMTVSRDMFLYQNVTRTPKPKNNGNRNGMGGSGGMGRPGSMGGPGGMGRPGGMGGPGGMGRPDRRR